MTQLIIHSAALLAAAVFACSFRGLAYSRGQVAVLLQEQAYPEVLMLVKNVPPAEQDNYLLNAAGYASYQTTLTDQAQDYYQQSLGKDTQNIQALFYLGLIGRQQHAYTEALQYFLKLTALRPENGHYYKLAAECYGALKQPDAAFAMLAAGYQYAGSDPSIAVAYSDALMERKNFATADTVIGSARILLPGSPPLISAAIKSAYLQKKYSDVFPLAGELLQSRNFAYAPVLYTMLAALQLKEYAVCISYAEVLQVGGYETEQSLYYTSKAYAGLKKYEESNQLLRQCIKKGISENLEAYYTDLAENRLAQKSYADAQLCYDTARYLSGNAVITYRKAIAYDAAGQDALAIKMYRAFIKNPGKGDTSLTRYAKQRTGSITK